MKKIKLNVEDFQVLSNDELRRIVAGTGSGTVTCMHVVLCTDGDSQGNAGQCGDASDGGSENGCFCLPVSGGGPAGPGGTHVLSVQCIMTTISTPPPIS